MIMPIRVLFQARNDTKDKYTWKYTVQERVIQLYDLVDSQEFVIISERIEIDDNTGAQNEYRNNTFIEARLFSKVTLLEVGAFMYPQDVVLQLKERIKIQGWGEVMEVEEIVLPSGRIFIQDGSLVCEES